jgi:hypothetical protein
MQAFGCIPVSHAQTVEARAVTEGAPQVNYFKLWKYDTMADNIGTLLERNPGWKIYLSKDVESTFIGGVAVTFDAVYCLIVPEGESPLGCLLLKSRDGEEPLMTFDDYRLDWVNVKDLVSQPRNKSLLEKFSHAHNGCVFALQYKGRNIRNINDPDEKEKWGRVSKLDTGCLISIFLITHPTHFHSLS